MKALILIIFLLSITELGFSGPTIFNGSNIKLLKDNLRFKTTDTKIMSGDTDDPSAVAKSADESSLYLRDGTNGLYIKTDSGSSTNWNKLLSDGHSSNLLSYGGYDAGVLSGSNGLTCTVGTCTHEVTNQFIGDGALKIALSTQAANIVKCYDNTNAQWDNQMVEASAYIKSSLIGVEMCYWDGSAESNCITYDASDKWKKIKIIEQVSDENSICYKIKSPSGTDNIFIDASSISALKIDGTTKVETQSYHIEQAQNALTDLSAEIEFNLGTATVINKDFPLIVATDNASSTRTEFVAQKKVSGTVCAFGVQTTGNNVLTIKKYNSSDAEVSTMSGTSEDNGAGYAAGGCSAISLDPNEYFTVHYSQNLLSNVAATKVSFTATHYEKKSVLSDSNASDQTNEFSVRIANSGSAAITSQSSPNNPAVASATRTGAGVVDIVFTTNFFSVAPSISATADSSSIFATYSSLTASGVTITTSDDDGANADHDADIIISRQGTDYKDFPQVVGTFRPAVKAARYTSNAGQPFESASTDIINFEDIDFDPDTLVSIGGSWSYTAPESGIYKVSVKIKITEAAGWNADEQAELFIYKNGSFYSDLDRFVQIVEPVTNDPGPSLQGSDLVDLEEGETLDVRMKQNTAATKTLDTSAGTNFISIVREDQAGRLSQEEPKKVQTKILSADVTTDNLDVSDFTYTGLTVGQHYRISGQLIGFDTGAADNYAIVYNSAAAGAGTVYGECKLGSNTTLYEFCGINVVFKAVSSTLYFHTESLTPAQFNGDGSKKESFVQLEEVNMIDTSQW